MDPAALNEHTIYVTFDFGALGASWEQSISSTNAPHFCMPFFSVEGQNKSTHKAKQINNKQKKGKKRTLAPSSVDFVAAMEGGLGKNGPIKLRLHPPRLLLAFFVERGKSREGKKHYTKKKAQNIKIKRKSNGARDG